MNYFLILYNKTCLIFYIKNYAKEIYAAKMCCQRNDIIINFQNKFYQIYTQYIFWSVEHNCVPFCWRQFTYDWFNEYVNIIIVSICSEIMHNLYNYLITRNVLCM